MSSVSSEPGTRAPAAVVTTPPGAVAAFPRGAALGAGVLAILVLFVFWQFFASQVRFAIRYQSDWGHTLVIPLIAGYFVYLNRQRLLDIPFRTTWVGLLPMVVGIALYVFCWLGPAAFRHHNLQGAGLGLTLFGLTLLFFGFRAMALLWFPLAYLVVFGQTISHRVLSIVTYPMQDLTAMGSWVMLKLVGMDVERQGNVLTVWSGGTQHHLNIAEACSGMRMLMAFLALGVAMAYTSFGRFWQRAALVLLGVPIAIFVNILRVVTLAVLSRVDSEFAAGDFHTFVGLLWLIPAFLLYLGVVWVLRNLVVETPAGKEAP